jgi:uncharacterized protein (DUF302 family)
MVLLPAGSDIADALRAAKKKAIPPASNIGFCNVAVL